MRAHFAAASLLVCVTGLGLGGLDPARATDETLIPVKSNPHQTTLFLPGRADAENTRREGDYCEPPREAFQPNTHLELRNAGDVPVENPRIIVSERGIFYSTRELLAAVTSPGSSEKEVAFLLWDLVCSRTYRMPSTGTVGWLHPLVHLGSFGFGDCAGRAHLLARLLTEAGIEARVWGDTSHTLTEALWEGEWHVLDADRSFFGLTTDGQRVAGVEELRRDHWLVKRAHTRGGPAGPLNPPLDARFARFFDASLTLQPLRATGVEPSLTLRPRESIRLSWEPAAKYCDYGFGEPSAGRPPPRLAQGELVYHPDLSDTLWLSLAHEAELLGVLAGEEEPPAVVPAERGVEGYAVLRMGAPFVIVGGSVTLEGSRQGTGHITLSFSRDGASWQPVTSLPRARPRGESPPTPAFRESVDLDPWIDPHGSPPTLDFYLRVGLLAPGPGDDVRLADLALSADLSLAPDHLPSLCRGENVIRYEDEGPAGERSLLLSWGWREEVDNRPPPPPMELSPRGGELVHRSAPLFRWSNPTDPDGDVIDDFELIVSRASDFPHPVSPGFHRYLSATPFAGETCWRPAREHLLVPGGIYYWRVRARDAAGCWSPWSETASFRVGTPAAPEEFSHRVAGKRISVTWEPAARMGTPVAYRVYGSSERGFTPDPQSLLGETVEEEMPVVCPGPAGRGPAPTFIRLQAVNAGGFPGPVSTYLELPHPFIYSDPSTVARAGAPYRYEPATLAEEPLRLEAPSLPPWLAVETEELAIAGTPSADDVGTWVVDLILSGSERGQARQRFGITVEGPEGILVSIPLPEGWSLIWGGAELPGMGLLEPPAERPPELLEVRAFETTHGPIFPWAGPVSEGSSAERGLLLHMGMPDTLEVRGGPFDATEMSFPLVAGWNLVPFTAPLPDSTTHALAELEENLVSVVGIDGVPLIYDPRCPAESNLHLMHPSRSYWVRVRGPDTLRFPADTVHRLLRGGMVPGGARWPGAAPPPSPYWGWLAADQLSVAGLTVAAGTPVEVLDCQGVLSGAGEVAEGGRLAHLPVSGDDPLSAADEGALPGEELRLMVGGVPYPCEPRWMPGEVVDVPPGAPLSPAAETRDEDEEGAGGPFLSPPVPNPTRGVASFLISLPETGSRAAHETTSGAPVLLIYDVTGRLVRTITLSAADAPSPGRLRTVASWDGCDEAGRAVASGLYWACLSPAGEQARQKVLLIR